MLNEALVHANLSWHATVELVKVRSGQVLMQLTEHEVNEAKPEHGEDVSQLTIKSVGEHV